MYVICLLQLCASDLCRNQTHAHIHLMSTKRIQQYQVTWKQTELNQSTEEYAGEGEEG